MKRPIVCLAAACACLLGAAWRLPAAASAASQDEKKPSDPKSHSSKPEKERSAADKGPALKKKLVPILTFGSSLNVGVAQVQGEERDVNKCKAVAQLETDYKDMARIKILVPIQSEKVIQHIDRVPGVSVSALADYAIKK